MAYWTMSERMGAAKTAGRVWVAPEGLPSAVAIETVGRVAIVVVGVGGEVEDQVFPSRALLWIFSLSEGCGSWEQKP